MGGAPLLLAIAVVTVDAGWESDGRDGYRYIIQIPAEQLREVERTGQITSQLPEDLRGRVSSVVIQVGNDPLPRPDVPPRTEDPAPQAADPETADPESPAQVASGPDATELSGAGPPKTYLPSPDETVRAQGDANGFGLPTMNNSAAAPPPATSTGDAISSATIGRLAATDRGSRVETPQPGQGGSPNSYGPSQFNGFETQSRGSSAAPSTSNTSSTSSNSSNVPSTSRSSAYGAAVPPDTGFTAADASRDNRWLPGPQPVNSADSATRPPAGTTQTPAGTSPTLMTPPASNPSTSYPPASNPSTSNPPATRREDPASAATSTSSPWSLPGEDRSSASNPPSLSGAGNYSPIPGSSTTGARSDQTTYGEELTTAEARQRAADRRLLEEVGIDSTGHAYDKRTNEPLYENDERYPLIVDYVRRMELAEKDRERQQSTTLPGRSLYDERVPADRIPPASRTNPPATGDSRSEWASNPSGYDPSGYDPRSGLNAYPGGYGPPPAYNQNPNYASYNQPPANTPPAGPWQNDPRVAQNPPPATQQPPAAETRQTRDESPSDTDELARASKSRDASVKTQPLFMFLLLLSIVGNIYLGIAISRLIRRYRNLVSTHRGTAITA